MDGVKPADWKDGKFRTWLDWNGGEYEAKLHDIVCKKMHHFAHVCFRARQRQYPVKITPISALDFMLDGNSITSVTNS